MCSVPISTTLLQTFGNTLTTIGPVRGHNTVPEINNKQYLRYWSQNWRLGDNLCVLLLEPEPEPIEPYLQHLKVIEEQIGNKQWILAGDANAKNTWLGSNIMDARGNELAGALDDMRMSILNKGDVLTYDTIRRGTAVSST